jgi:hypothetical protein
MSYLLLSLLLYSVCCNGLVYMQVCGFIAVYLHLAKVSQPGPSYDEMMLGAEAGEEAVRTCLPVVSHSRCCLQQTCKKDRTH